MSLTHRFKICDVQKHVFIQENEEFKSNTLFSICLHLNPVAGLKKLACNSTKDVALDLPKSLLTTTYIDLSKMKKKDKKEEENISDEMQGAKLCLKPWEG